MTMTSLLRNANNVNPPSTTRIVLVNCHPKRLVRWFAIWGIVALVLVSVDVSTATRNPLSGPLSSSSSSSYGNYNSNGIHYSNTNSNYNSNSNYNDGHRQNPSTNNANDCAQAHTCMQTHTLRGGSTILQPPPPPPMQGEQRLQQQQQQQQLEESTQSMLHQQQQLQQQQHQQQQQQALHNHRSEPQRYGETSGPTAFLPKIGLKQVTRALLHTSEWNRKLLRGVQHWGRFKSSRLVTSQSHSNSQSHSTDQQQQQQQQLQPHQPRQVVPSSSYGHPHPHYQQQNVQHVSHPNHHYDSNSNSLYGNLPVNVHPSRTWQPPIEAFSGRSLEEEELTLFHAKMPRTRSGREEIDTDEAETIEGPEGAHRLWGPDLLPYLQHIAETLEMDLDGNNESGNANGNETNGIELFLAMIYLDRACSVETPRRNGVPACPYCQPRTVHRLGLAALVVASRAVCKSEKIPLLETNVAKLSASLGIPRLQLQQMVDWMVAALGDDGLYVGLEEMKAWSRTWESFVEASK